MHAAPRTFLVTGGAGFIGSAVVRHLITRTAHRVVVIDKLTYAASLAALAPVAADARFTLIRADICDGLAMRAAFATHRPNIVLHLAAESHVDRSIDGPAVFMSTNVLGTFTLLEAALEYWRALEEETRAAFRFHHVSTDEVFGSLGPTGAFDETTAYDPRSPYSASKAASDHLVRAWHHTYGLPTIVTNCSNNYGPYHFPEKLIPLTILNALEGKPLPVYGTGENVRDWLFVEDHAEALILAAERAAPGAIYCIGGGAERRNIDVVRAICRLLDAIVPTPALGPRDRLIAFVTDRPGHDARYAIDATRFSKAFGWTPRRTFEQGLEETVRWFLSNRPWWEEIRAARYAGQRLGMETERKGARS